MPTLTCLGAAGTVTGSKHLLEHQGRRILLDCGLFQGVKELRERNWEPLPVDPRTIDAVVLSHAHLDHCGYLPRLIRDGFAGPIYCTAASRAVARLILLDSARIQEQDAAYLNRNRLSKHDPALPLYDVLDAERTLDAFVDCAFGEPVLLENGAELRFRRAGHILGAATVEVRFGGRRVVFSGDLGRYDDPVMYDPEPVAAADYVLVESTYGDRVHDLTDPVDALAAILGQTLERGGTLLIPAFAVGRTQALLYYFSRLRERGLLDGVPVFLDSPMAISASDLLRDFGADHRLDTETCERVCAVAEYTREASDSKRLSANRKPKVVISASGMATGGRVLHHLKAFGPDDRSRSCSVGSRRPGPAGAHSRRVIET